MNEIDVASNLYLLLAALGLAISVQYAELPILGQSAFVAIGGFGTFQLTQNGLPLGIAVGVSVCTAAVGGYLLGLGVGRLEAAPLALATWALAWLAQAVLTGFPSISGGSQGLVRPAPTTLVSHWLGISWTLTTTAHLVLAAILCVVALLALHRLDRGPIGLDLAALRAGPALAASLGVRVRARRCQVLAATAALGALGGAGSAVLLGTVAPSDVGPLLSIQLLIAVVLAGSFRPYGVVAGFAVIAALPHVADAIASATDAPAERVRAAVTAGLLVVALLLRSRLRGHRTNAWPLPATGGERSEITRAATGTVLLRARDVRMHFGAVAALDGVDLDVRAGEVHALVGPNGSGKTTLLRVLAGAMPPHSGQVDVVSARAVRTPQQTVLLAGLTPLAQAAVGARADGRTRLPGLRHLVATPSSSAYAEQLTNKAAGALAAVGLLAKAEDDAAQLGAGDQRLLQVARAVATGARVLLLDEPAAGMTPTERSGLATAIRTWSGNGTAVCLVEHDMRFVNDVADRVTVLAAGRVLTSGDPSSVRRDARVRRAYLGDDDVNG
ncbi:MAG: ATP-binding cassette domain-containing protein [Actinomycetes bacterium]